MPDINLTDIFSAVGYHLSNLVGEVRANRDKEYYAVTRAISQNPDLLDVPKYRGILKHHGYTDADFQALKAHRAVSNIAELLKTVDQTTQRAQAQPGGPVMGSMGGVAGGGGANMSPTPSARIALPAAQIPQGPAPTGGPPPGGPPQTGVQQLAERLGPATLGIRERGMQLTVRGAQAGTGRERATADRASFGQEMQSVEDQLVQSGIDRGRARRAAYETTSESYRRQGRIVPAPTDPGLQERMRTEAQLSPGPGGGTLAGAVTGERTRAKIEAEKGSRTLADVKRAGTTFYPEGHAKQGEQVPSGTTVAEAERLGAVTVPQVTANLMQQLSGPTSILNEMADAAKVVNTGKTRFEQVERGAAILAERKIEGRGPSVKALTKQEATRGVLLSILRSPIFGEKGNMAARILDVAKPTAITVWDTEDEKNAKLEFFGGVLASVLHGIGVPLRPDQKALLEKLDPQIREQIDALPGGEAPGGEGAPSQGADDPYLNLQRKYAPGAEAAPGG